MAFNFRRPRLWILFPLVCIGLLCVLDFSSVLSILRRAEKNNGETSGWAFATLFSRIQTITYKCNDKRDIGGMAGGDGTWTVCFDDFKPEPDCQVYSFGINNDFSFDDQIMTATGCAVHSFDPTMGVPETTRFPKSFFHPVAIGPKSDDKYTLGDKYSMGAKNVVWKMRTLGDLRKELGSKRLPIIKMDVEFNEWAVLQEWFTSNSLDGVDQLLMEVHFWPNFEDPNRHKELAFQIDVLRKWTRILDNLHRLGFRLFNVHTNRYSTAVQLGLGFDIPCCFEVSYIRVGSIPAEQAQLPASTLAPAEALSADPESSSGAGSTLASTQRARKLIASAFQMYKVKKFLDSPCGDCNWQPSIEGMDDVLYTGIDKDPDIIAANARKYFNRTNLRFANLDLVADNDILATGNFDAVMCSDVVQHLPIEDGMKIYQNLEATGAKIMITDFHVASGHPAVVASNENIPVGYSYPNNPMQPPFNFSKPLFYIVNADEEYIKEHPEEAIKLMAVFELPVVGRGDGVFDPNMVDLEKAKAGVVAVGKKAQRMLAKVVV